MTTGKTIALTRWTFVGKVMSLLFNMLSIAAAATAKSLQLYPILCDPIDGSPPGSTILGILQARTLKLLQEGGPLPGPKTGLLSNTRKLIVQGDTCADKARDYIGKGTQVESSRVREPRRTALSHGLQSQVFW